MNEPMRLEATAADVMVKAKAAGDLFVIEAAELARLRLNAARWAMVAKHCNVSLHGFGMKFVVTIETKGAHSFAEAVDAAIAAEAPMV